MVPGIGVRVLAPQLDALTAAAPARAGRVPAPRIRQQRIRQRGPHVGRTVQSPLGAQQSDLEQCAPRRSRDAATSSPGLARSFSGSPNSAASGRETATR